MALVGTHFAKWEGEGFGEAGCAHSAAPHISNARDAEWTRLWVVTKPTKAPPIFFGFELQLRDGEKLLAQNRHDWHRILRIPRLFPTGMPVTH